jgi:hypothetical protein
LRPGARTKFNLRNKSTVPDHNETDVSNWREVEIRIQHRTWRRSKNSSEVVETNAYQSFDSEIQLFDAFLTPFTGPIYMLALAYTGP